MTINIHFTDADWQRLEKDWSAWWAGESDRPMVMIEEHLPLADGSTAGFWEGIIPYQFANDVPAEQVIAAVQQGLESRRFYGDSWPRWWLNFGPGIVSGFLGSDVLPQENTVWFETKTPRPLNELRFEYDAQNPWWRRVQELTTLAVECWGDKVCVGHTDLGGNLDILASFRTTQNLLTDLVDDPEEVARLAGEITRLWLRYYDELYNIIQTNGRGTTPWAKIWSPKRTYMLQSDFSYMVSPRMFKRFILPDLEACCAQLDHAFYHLDGPGQVPHLKHLLSLEKLVGIQWIPGAGSPPPEEWLPLLKEIRDGGKLCQVFVSPEGARTIVRELGGKGFALAVEQSMTREEADAYLETLRSEDKNGW